MFILLASLLFIATSGSAGSALAADVTPASQALSKAVAQFESGHEAEAYTLFESIPVDAPEFALALPEIQKIHYKNKSWDLFFGHAAFYKAKLLENHFEPNLLLLETMALIKHCEFEAAGKILALAKSKTNPNRYPLESEQIAEIENLLYLQSELGKPVVTTAQKNKPKAFTKQLQWNIATDKQFELIRRAVKNPQSLRIYVKDSCASATADQNPSSKGIDVAEGTCLGKDCKNQKAVQ